MNKYKSNVFLKENEKKDIKIEMTFMGPLHIGLLILCMHTCKHQTIALKSTSKLYNCS